MDPVLARLLWAALLGMAVAAVLGVLYAAMGKRRAQVRAAERHALLVQFRYALSDDPESAVEELTRGVAADAPGGVETWFALGSLLRRKGDCLRAIRLHEELVGNPRLHPSVRRAAAYELALDFRRAGMFGRAAETLRELVQAEPDHREALRELREIAEEERDWRGAVDAQRRLVAAGGGGETILAHLHAALARDLLAQGRVAEAAQAVEEGLQADPDCADALAARAAVALARGDRPAAAAALGQALDRCPELAAESVPLLEELADADFLRDRLALHPGHPWLQLSLARRLRREGRASDAAGLLRDLLGRQPHLAEARQELAEVLLEGPSPGEADLRAELADLLAGLGAPERPFACDRCGVELVAFTFRCPRCVSWDTVRNVSTPRREPRQIEPDRRSGT